jgi:acetolactate synthase-1/2/3 large subunit
MTHPEQSYIRAAGSLGWGFPASLGAKCGVSDRPVVCFTGDGGLWYHISELETASRYGIKTVTVVNNNHTLNQDAHGLRQQYGDQPENDGLVKFQETNFVNIAREMGCMGIRVEKADEIAGALKKALETDRPALVEVITDPNCAAPSPWTPE